MSEHPLPRNVAGDVQFVPPVGLTAWPPVEQWTEVEWGCWLGQHGYSPEEVAQYLDHDRFAYGVGFTPTGERARPHNAYDAGVKWLYKPTPKGVTLHKIKESPIVRNVLWGGAASGTKSTSARWEAIGAALFSGLENYRAIIFRRELEELRRSHLDKIDVEAKAICAVLGNDKAIKVTSQPPVATFLTTGAKILFGYAEHEGDEKKYQTEEYDLFVGDEATLLKWKQIVGIQSRVRADTKTGRFGRMILTTNPGGPSHEECVEHFITKTVSLAKNKKYDPAQFAFISAALYDNPFQMDADGSFESYESRLYMFEPERRRQLLGGDWSAIVDQFFGTFDPRLHVRSLG